MLVCLVFFTCRVVCPLVHTRPLSPRLGSQSSAAPWPSHGSLVPDAVTPLYIARHPPGPGPVTGHPVTSRSGRADSEYRGPLGSGRLGIRPRSHPCPARADSDYRWIVGSGRLGSQRPVTSHDADYSGPTGSGNLPSRVRVFARAGPMPIVKKVRGRGP